MKYTEYTEYIEAYEEEAKYQEGLIETYMFAIKGHENDIEALRDNIKDCVEDIVKYASLIQVCESADKDPENVALHMLVERHWTEDGDFIQKKLKWLEGIKNYHTVEDEDDSYEN